MNLAKTISFISILFIVIVFSGCKQYEEDSFITLKSIKNRLLDKTWSLENLTINGIDSTKRFSNKGFSLQCKDVGETFTNTFHYTLSYTYNSLYLTTTGDFSMPSRGDYFQFDSYNYPTNYSGSNPYTYNKSFIFDYNSKTNETAQWKITKLDSDEFHLETTISDENSVGVYGSYTIKMKLKVN